MTDEEKALAAAYHREYMKRYRKENAEKLRQKQNEWRKNNPDKVREYRKRYWEKKVTEAQTMETEAGKEAIKRGE